MEKYDAKSKEGRRGGGMEEIEMEGKKAMHLSTSRFFDRGIQSLSLAQSPQAKHKQLFFSGDLFPLGRFATIANLFLLFFSFLLLF